MPLTKTDAEDLRRQLREGVARVGFEWAQFCTLNANAESLLVKGRWFFSSVLRMWPEHIVVMIASLLDGKRVGHSETLTFHQLLAWIEANDPSFGEQFKKQLTTARQIASPVTKYRNRLVAHYDLGPLIQQPGHLPIVPVSFATIGDAIRQLEILIEMADSHLDGSEPDWNSLRPQE